MTSELLLTKCRLLLRSAFDSKFCKLLGRTEYDKQNDPEGETSTVIDTLTQFFTFILSHEDIKFR